MDNGNFIFAGLIEISNACADLSLSSADGSYEDPHDFCAVAWMDDDSQIAATNWEIIGSSIWLGRYSSYYTSSEDQFVKVTVFLGCGRYSEGPCDFFLSDFELMSPDIGVLIERDYRINSDIESSVKLRPGGGIEIPIRYLVPKDAEDFLLYRDDHWDSAYFRIAPTFN